MKKVSAILLLIVFIVFGQQVSAKQIDQFDAKKIASEFVSNSSNSASKKYISSKSRDLRLAYVANVKEQDSEGQLYVFNCGENGGYIVVAGDDNVKEPVLGYADSGSFDYEQMPENMRWWIDEYARQIEYIQSNDAATTYMPQRRAILGSVAPLLGDVKWNQDYPYNLQCPVITYSNGTQSNAVTGCVATAMAQIMYYHRWPEYGTGSHSYDWVYDNKTTTLSADFSQSVYDWDAMTPTYDEYSSDESRAAVAKLMSDVGIAVDMMYGESSGAYDIYAARALVTYFGYDKGVQKLDRRLFPQSEWEDMIYSELNASRPVYYSGSSETGGHAFVLDGYNTDGYFHINWGWGGYGNGYFRTTALDPYYQGIGGFAGGYNLNQAMIIGVQKPQETTTQVTPSLHADAMYPDYAEYNIGDNVTIHLENYFGSHIENISFSTALLISDLNDAEVARYGKSSFITLAPLYGWYDYQFKVNFSEIPVGQYKIKAQYQIEGEEEFHDVKLPINYPKYLVMTVTETKVSFSYPENFSSQLVMSDLKCDHAIVNTTIKASGKITNMGECEYYDEVYMAIVKDNGLVSLSAPYLIDVETGESETIEVEIDTPQNPGTYTLAFVFSVNGNYYLVSGEPLTINVEEGGPAPVFDITEGLDAPDTMSPDNIHATVTIKNTGGYFAGYFELLIVNGSNYTYYPANTLTEYVTLDTNETKTISFQGTMTEDIIYGQEYFLALKNPLSEEVEVMCEYEWFTLVEGEVEGPKFAFIGNLEAPDTMTPDNIHATITVKNMGGYFEGYFYLLVVNGSTNIYGNNIIQEYVTLETDEAKTITFQGEMVEDINYGHEYFLALAYPVSDDLLELLDDYKWFTLGDYGTNIENIEADNNEVVEYYNLQGVKVAKENLTPGIYIKRSNNQATKVLVK